ncbi:MAG TPA: methylated-DNA--[protein]-cysteine S-methyltransferase [Solirubrobacterales bacterium]|nr:methylated-DNA--[protein]-cysteine S-methyltransferase [Solirubrobacterales bacterium]
MVDGPIGELTVLAGPAGISRIYFADSTPAQDPVTRRPLPELEAQLGRYFAGELQAFDLDLDPQGTPLQLAVWRRLLAIPYGQTSTYGEVARQIDESLYDAGLEPYRRPRVVGAAIGANPLAVIVPCHRVIGSDGSLTGYYGGLERKRTLLELEGLAVSGDSVRTAPSRQQLAML